MEARVASGGAKAIKKIAVTSRTVHANVNIMLITVLPGDCVVLELVLGAPQHVSDLLCKTSDARSLCNKLSSVS